MAKPTVTVYTPGSSLHRPNRMMYEMFQDLYRGRELAWRLAVRDIAAQYRQTLLGWMWALILPLANTVTWIFLSGTGIVAVGETILPYPIYVFTGTMLWGIFMDALNSPIQQTSGAVNMLTKLNFPREALILSGIYQTLFNSGLKVSLLLAALLLAGIRPGWSLLLFPVALLSLIMVGNIVGLLLTPIGMLYSDIGKAIPLLSQFLMYLTPVVYPVPEEGWIKSLIILNPLTPLILTARDWLTNFAPEYLGFFIAINFLSIVVFIFVWAGYRLAMPIIIERINA